METTKQELTNEESPPDNSMLEKTLARWIYWEDNIYYCYDCVEKRLAEINANKEFAEHIDYESGDECGYYEDYAPEESEHHCCKCSRPLFSTGIDS